MSYGVTYILQAGDENLFKVGHTRTPIEQRVKALQTGCPHPIKVYKTVASYFPERLEKILHKLMHEYRKQGEWFAVPVEVIDRVLSAPLPGGNPWSLHGDPWQGVSIAPTSFTRDADGRPHVSCRCITKSELEAEVYRLVTGLFKLLDDFEDPFVQKKPRYRSHVEDI